MLKIFAVVGLGLILLLVGLGYRESLRMPSIERAWHTDAEIWAQDTVRRALRDPASAEFRSVSKHRIGDGHEITNLAVCGEVNARNGFGGFTGFTRFLVIFHRAGDGRISALPPAMDEGLPAVRARFDQAWLSQCTGASRIS